MSLFFQPEKRFSNQLRVKDRKGAAYRRMLGKRHRQEPLPGTRKLQYGRQDKAFARMLEDRKKQR